MQMSAHAYIFASITGLAVGLALFVGYSIYQTIVSEDVHHDRSENRRQRPRRNVSPQPSSKAGGDSDFCSICRTPIRTRRYICGHKFHNACLVIQLQTDFLCPTCFPDSEPSCSHLKPQNKSTCRICEKDFPNKQLDCGLHKVHEECLARSFEKARCPLCPRRSNNGPNKCDLCTEDFDEQVTLKCKHQFHKKCLEKWTNLGNTCPNCRKQL